MLISGRIWLKDTLSAISSASAGGSLLISVVSVITLLLAAMGLLIVLANAFTYKVLPHVKRTRPDENIQNELIDQVKLDLYRLPYSTSAGMINGKSLLP